MSLADRQAELVAALVAGAPVPPGFDPARLGVAQRALLRKRAGEVARVWPMLAAAAGDRWPEEFAAWAGGRPPQGSLRDGWDLARAWLAAGRLAGAAAGELAEREAAWHYDGRSAPRRRPRWSRHWSRHRSRRWSRRWSRRLRRLLSRAR
jgi:hypothetical protein